MHQALRIPEILLNIFGHCSAPVISLRKKNYNSDLAVLARTCRTFKEPALDVLWEGLCDLSPLPRCLPEACRLAKPAEKPLHYCRWSNEPCYLFSRPLKEVEWNTLRDYTRRIRFLHFYFGCVHEDTIKKIFASCDDPLFPHLRSLVWNGVDAFTPLHVAVPSLTMLQINLRSSQTVNKLLNAFGDRCPHIETLKVDTPSHGLTNSTLSWLVCRWPKLQQVVCPNVALSMDAISYLSSVSNLKRLELRTEIGLIEDISRLGSMLVFSNLTYLDIGAEPLDAITSLLHYIRLPAIETLYVELTSGHVSGRALQACWAAVREACPSNVVTNLRLRSIIDEVYDIDLGEDLLPRLTLEDLRPCTAFAELRELHIDFNCSVDLTDHLLELVSHRMEVLVINDDWGWKTEEHGGGITLSGLVQLLRRCPSLHRVCLAIDTQTFTEIPEGLDVSFPPRRPLEVNFVDSYIFPEFIPDLVSVLTALGLDPSMLKVWEILEWELVGQEEPQLLWEHVLNGLRNAS